MIRSKDRITVLRRKGHADSDHQLPQIRKRKLTNGLQHRMGNHVPGVSLQLLTEQAASDDFIDRLVHACPLESGRVSSPKTTVPCGCFESRSPSNGGFLAVMSDSDPTPELEVKSDSEWKQRVKQEAADLDAQRTQEGAQPTGDQPAEQAPAATETARSRPSAADVANLPPADFSMLVGMFSTQAMVSLGVIPNPETGKPQRNLPLAKHFIDLLEVLQDKTRRNLTGHEANLLEGSLHELRMAFVELSKPESTAQTD